VGCECLVESVEGTTGYEFRCTLGDSISVYENLAERLRKSLGEETSRWGDGVVAERT